MHMLTEEETHDLEFGRWLKSQRERCRFTLRQASVITSIPIERLIELETGLNKKAITRTECRLLSAIYDLDHEHMTAQALGVH